MFLQTVKRYAPSRRVVLTAACRLWHTVSVRLTPLPTRESDLTSQLPAAGPPACASVMQPFLWENRCQGHGLSNQPGRLAAGMITPFDR